MQTDFVELEPDDLAEEAAKAFERYDLVSAPVVDPDGKLVGGSPSMRSSTSSARKPRASSWPTPV
jgi:predicted transcriptional regulator